MQRLALSLCIVAIAAVMGRVSAQEGGLPSSLEITDPRSPDADLASGDVLGLEAWDGGPHLAIAVRMAIPLDEGMYTQVELHIDCDDDPDSGIAGCELRVVAAVGSRFAPNVLPSRGEETSDPLAIRRASWSQIEIYETVATGSREPSWFLTGTLAPPTVNDDTLLILIPRELIQELGDRYHRRLRFRASVTTTCSEQPLLLRYVCADEGLPIAVDGRSGDWSGEGVVRDPGDELHPAVRDLDVLALRIDHDENEIFALVELQQSGLIRDSGLALNSEIVRSDRVKLHVEPLLPAYSPARTIEIPAGHAKGTRSDERWCIEGTTLEVGISRESAQQSFQVVAWTEARRIDEVPNEGWLRLELGSHDGPLSGEARPHHHGEGRRSSGARPAGKTLPGFHGTIAGEESWSGEVILDGDVEIAATGRLHIAAGTRVRIGSRDTTGAGWRKDRIEIHVKGTLEVEGTLDDPVRFEPLVEVAPPESLWDADAAPWHGIVFWPERGAGCRVAGAVFRSAYAALQVPEGALSVDDAVFFGCGNGLEIGAANADRHRAGIDGGPAMVQVRRSRFARCYAGVHLNLQGTAHLNRCVFSRNVHAVGNRGPCIVFWLAPPGAVVDHCLFSKNRVAVTGAGIITSSLFVGNHRVAALTGHHGVFDSNIDYFAYAGNTLHDNRTLIEGEAVLGRDNVFADPMITGNEAALDATWPPLPADLDLAPDSPARGTAVGGGDPGPTGGRGAGAAEIRWRPQGAPLRGLLAFRFPVGSAANIVDRLRARISSGIPKPGGKLGPGWWVAPPLDDSALLSLRPLADSAGEVWLAGTLMSDGAAEVSVEINGDWREIQLWWNRKPLEETLPPHRLDERGALITLPARRGSNTLVARVRVRSGGPKFGVAIAGEGIAEPRRDPPKRALRILAARVTRAASGARWLRLKLSDSLNWSDDGRDDLIDYLDDQGTPRTDLQPMAARIRGIKELEIGPLPDYLEGPLSLRCANLRTPSGHRYPSDPRPCAVRGL